MGCALWYLDHMHICAFARSFSDTSASVKLCGGGAASVVGLGSRAVPGTKEMPGNMFQWWRVDGWVGTVMVTRQVSWRRADAWERVVVVTCC